MTREHLRVIDDLFKNDVSRDVLTAFFVALFTALAEESLELVVLLLDRVMGRLSAKRKVEGKVCDLSCVCVRVYISMLVGCVRVLSHTTYPPPHTNV